jgi:hypothetical protein
VNLKNNILQILLSACIHRITDNPSPDKYPDHRERINLRNNIVTPYLKGWLHGIQSPLNFKSYRLFITFNNETTNSVAPEPEGSSPHSQEPATSPSPEPGESTPYPPTNLPKFHFDPILPSTPWSLKWSFSFGLSHQNPVPPKLLERLSSSTTNDCQRTNAHISRHCKW